MRSWILLVLVGAAGATAGCDSPPASAKAIVGSYDVMVTQSGVSDEVFMNIRQGSGDAILLTFTAGITTDPGGLNADGVRCKLNSPSTFMILEQQVHIDHSTGNLDGTLTGDGMVAADGTFAAVFHYAPTTMAGTVLDYDLSGQKQQ
jgi:hypothetical protein